jgi:hypothetical protein
MDKIKAVIRDLFFTFLSCVLGMAAILNNRSGESEMDIYSPNYWGSVVLFVASLTIYRFTNYNEK